MGILLCPTMSPAAQTLGTESVLQPEGSPIQWLLGWIQMLKEFNSCCPGRDGVSWVLLQEVAAGDVQGHRERSWTSPAASGSPSYMPARVRTHSWSKPVHVDELIPSPPRGEGTWWGLPWAGGNKSVL